jgi:hypothetical protein
LPACCWRVVRSSLTLVFEDFVFEAADAFLGHGDLVLHGQVFLVGLDLHQLIFEFGQAALDHGEVLVERAFRGLIFGEPGFDRVQRLLSRVDAFVQRLQRRGQFGESPSTRFRVHIELLEADEALEVRRHVSTVRRAFLG